MRRAWPAVFLVLPLAGCAPAVVEQWVADVEKTLQPITSVPRSAGRFKDLDDYKRQTGEWLRGIVFDFEEWHDIPQIMREQADRRFEGYFAFKHYYGHKAYVGGWREDNACRFRLYQWTGTNYLRHGHIVFASEGPEWRRQAGMHGLTRIFLRQRR